jgi:hypothetical protein
MKDTQSGANATLSGAAVINSSPLTINTPNGPVVQSAGQAISQQISAGLAGANYVYRFKGAGTDGNTYEADVIQFVVPYVPTP